MNIQVRYYTRSGNTKKLADSIAKAVGVTPEDISNPMVEKADILFLGCSYYAFDMDTEVKKFINENSDKIGKIVCFGTSAMMNSMQKPLKKILEGTAIELAKEEFHCRGSFGVMHKGRPNADDMALAADFAKKYIKK